MLKHLEGARLGLFVFLGTVLIVIGILFIGNKDSLFTSTITIKSVFDEIEGLKTGAPVQLSGYNIGSVNNISLASDTSGKVIVEMRIEESVRNFVRLNSVASIGTEGLVGKKIVSITPGTTEYEVVSNGGMIESVNPVNIQAIISESRGVIANLREMTKNFADITQKVNTGKGTVGKIFNDDELYYSAVNLTKSADESLDNITTTLNEITDYIVQLGSGLSGIMSNVDTTMVSVKELTAKLNSGEGALGALIADKSVYDSVKTVITNLVQTSEYASSGASKFAENMEALKHNWLFKSYFEERGYWDEAEYQQEIDKKLRKLFDQQNKLDEKIEQLKELQEKLSEMQNK